MVVLKMERVEKTRQARGNERIPQLAIAPYATETAPREGRR
ncbi:hypothetical protein Q4F19_11880 [Sphingomonas sp. BIUV-7]|uniref:Uncharacterized protein n=1 Tax=Sphingomonas natans TaxID=3063330 RepID=A0ABT8Y9R9_9SPHN|nr:hypothetical protein [Sphingomonas sp. BIUV-7]MDO6415081.1 hypothetical protein [Sphingomonas sp. BIUV-7]